MYEIDNIDSRTLVHNFSKQSLLPITEIDSESEKLLELTGQLVFVGVLSLNDENELIRKESNEILKRTLPKV